MRVANLRNKRNLFIFDFEIGNVCKGKETREKIRFKNNLNSV